LDVTVNIQRERKKNQQKNELKKLKIRVVEAINALVGRIPFTLVKMRITSQNPKKNFGFLLLLQK
jgi:hypothetical protein